MNVRVSVNAGDQDAIITSTDSVTIGYTNNTSCRFNGFLTQASNVGTANAWKFTRFFSKGGLYKVRFVYKKDTNCGKVNIGLDSSATSIVSALDTYVASATYNNVYESTLEITRGFHDVTFAVNGKNASSSNYQIQMETIQFDPIQEYQLYQDDKPIQTNQGSMVLLGKHKVTVAESTFTFPLADILNTKYSEIIVKINGSATASLALQATVNGLGANYIQKGLSSIGGTVTAINITTGSILKIASTSILTGATKFEAWFTIKRQDDGTWTMGQWGATGFSVGHETGSWNNDQTSTTGITQIVISTSTSTVKVGTEYEIYGVKTT